MRHLRKHASEARNLERVVTLLHAAGDEEEQARDQAVRNHSIHRGVDTEARKRRNAEHHEAHVRDRRKRDQALHIGLREASERAVDNADDRESADIRRPLDRCERQDRQSDAHEAVGAKFQQDCGKDYRALSRCLRVRVWQPGVKRKHRNLDCETDEHAGKYPNLHVLSDRAAVLDKVRDRETLCPGLEEHCQKCDQHQRRPEHCVQEELQRRVLAILAAPHADHEIHWQQHKFEEDKEQDQVLGDEGTRHAGLQDQYQHEKGLRIARRWNMVPRIDHHEQCDHHRQEVQRQADAVDAYEIGAPNYRNPIGLSNKLHLTRIAKVELQQRVHADSNSGDRRQQCDQLDQLLFAPWHNKQHKYADDRQERADAEHPICVTDHFHGVDLPYLVEIMCLRLRGREQRQQPR